MLSCLLQARVCHCFIFLIDGDCGVIPIIYVLYFVDIIFIPGFLGSTATLTIGAASKHISVKAGHATVLVIVADFRIWFSSPPIPR